MKAYLFTEAVWQLIREYLACTHRIDYYWHQMDAEVAPKVLDIIRTNSVKVNAVGSVSFVQLIRDNDTPGANVKAELYISASTKAGYDSVAANIKPFADYYALIQSEDDSKDWVLIGSPYRRNKFSITLPTPPQKECEKIICISISAHPVAEGIIIREK